MSDLIIEQITDYDVNLELILTQFQDSEKLKGIISSAHKSANDIEQALWEILTEMCLDNAIGAQLDIIGRVFDVDRAGQTDEEYREAIRIKASTSYSGEPEAIISILRSMFGASFVDYAPLYPGKFYAYTDLGLTSADLEKFAPAGVGALFGYAIVDYDGKFLVDEQGNKIIAVL